MDPHKTPRRSVRLVLVSNPHVQAMNGHLKGVPHLEDEVPITMGSWGLILQVVGGLVMGWDVGKSPVGVLIS